MKLTSRQVQVLRMMANRNTLLRLADGRNKFSGGGPRISDKVLKPLYDEGLVEFQEQIQETVLMHEGYRAARHGLEYEGPAGTPMNVQEYARLQADICRQLRKDGYSESRSYHLGQDPNESGVIEWWTKGGVLLLVEFNPIPPIGVCTMYVPVKQHNGNTGAVTTEPKAMVT